jgi:hypothetical protein
MKNVKVSVIIPVLDIMNKIENLFLLKK